MTDPLAQSILDATAPTPAASTRVLGVISGLDPLTVTIPSCASPVSAQACAHVTPVVGATCIVEIFGRASRIVTGVLP